jgi:GAF domain-containing protein
MPSEEGAMTELSEMRVFDKPLDGTVQAVVDLARRSLDHCDGVGIRLLDRNGVSARVFTDTRSSQFDALQDELDDGPCIECVRTRTLCDLGPITPENRGPSFARSARDAGLIACLGLPLVVDGEVIGALNLYGWPVGEFGGWNRQHCTDFAEQASISLANALAYARTQVVIVGLEAELAASDDRVHQAHGVLMALGDTTLDGAIRTLSELADAQNSTLVGAAQSVLDSLAAGN